jgi:hypothetical protein
MVLAIAPGLIRVGVRDLLRRAWRTRGTFAFRPKRNVDRNACFSGLSFAKMLSGANAFEISNIQKNKLRSR